MKFICCSIFLILCFQSSTIAQNRTMGVFSNTPDAYNGYTLLSNNEWTYLINNCGQKIKEWKSAYKTGHGTYLLPNGDLLRAGALGGNFNAGGRGGIFELYDWEGNLKWQYTIADENRQAHHDIAPLPNGHFLCTIWELKSEQEAKSQGRKYNGSVWSERILEIEMLPNNQANIVWEWSIWDHLIQDHDASKSNFGAVQRHPELLDLNYIGNGQETAGNWLHLNAIDYNEELDQIVISSRNLSEIYVIDHSTTTTEAAGHQGGRYGKGGDILYRYGNPQVYQNGTESDRQLNKQHDIRWIEKGLPYEGAFSVFNNHYIENRQSRIQIFNNPADENGIYQFVNGNYGEDSLIYDYTMPFLYSDILSGAEIMPNENILILEGRSGHLLEINAQEEIVWDYIYPVNRNGGPGIQGGEPRFNLLFRAKKYPIHYSAFDGKELIAGDPIELSPLEEDCDITSTIKSESSHENESLILRNSLIRQALLIESRMNPKVKPMLYLYHLSGQLKYKNQIEKGVNNYSLTYLPQGLYVAVIKIDNRIILSEKVVKF